MLQNAYFLAKIGADTAENEQHFAEILFAAPHFHFREGPRAAREVPLRHGRVRADPAYVFGYCTR